MKRPSLGFLMIVALLFPAFAGVFAGSSPGSGLETAAYAGSSTGTSITVPIEDEPEIRSINEVEWVVFGILLMLDESVATTNVVFSTDSMSISLITFPEYPELVGLTIIQYSFLSNTTYIFYATNEEGTTKVAELRIMYSGSTMTDIWLSFRQPDGSWIKHVS